MIRESLRVVSVVLILITAGCGGLGGFVSGDQSLSFSAGSVHVSEEVVSESPFTLASDKSVSFERSLEAAGQSRTVKMNAHMVHLKRSYQGAPLGSLVVLSIPQIKMLGQQIKVTEQVSPASLISQAQSSSAEVQETSKIGERSVRILGQNRTVEVFSGTAKKEGESANAKIYVATFDYEGDTIIAVAIVPRISGEEEDAVLDLMKGIQYEG